MYSSHELVLWWRWDGTVRLCADGGWTNEPNRLLSKTWDNLEAAVAQFPQLQVVINFGVV
jgi:hypothetical protein